MPVAAVMYGCRKSTSTTSMSEERILADTTVPQTLDLCDRLSTLIYTISQTLASRMCSTRHQPPTIENLEAHRWPQPSAPTLRVISRQSRSSRAKVKWRASAFDQRVMYLPRETRFGIPVWGLSGMVRKISKTPKVRLSSPTTSTRQLVC